MKRLGVLLLPLDGSLVYHKATLSILSGCAKAIALLIKPFV